MTETEDMDDAITETMTETTEVVVDMIDTNELHDMTEIDHVREIDIDNDLLVEDLHPGPFPHAEILGTGLSLDPPLDALSLHDELLR
jgi:hypothetical protein